MVQYKLCAIIGFRIIVHVFVFYNKHAVDKIKGQNASNLVRIVSWNRTSRTVRYHIKTPTNLVINISDVHDIEYTVAKVIRQNTSHYVKGDV